MTNSNKVVHVAAAVIEQENKILIAKRPNHVHQGGLWEFPGGKVEENESVVDALQRELQEEIGITSLSHAPLIQIKHDYSDKSVLLDVCKVTAFTGQAQGMEGQEIKWVTKEELSDYSFPEANLPIINAASLPPYYLITPEPEPNNLNIFLQQLDRSLNEDIKLAQLRAKHLNSKQFEMLVQEALKIAAHRQTELFINCDLDTALKLGIQKVHLSSHNLNSLTRIDSTFEISASCHTPDEIKKAHQLGARFAVLSCVKATASHPNVPPLGWEAFKSLCFDAKLPIYALGGMQKNDLKDAKQHGGQGIAGISTFWTGKT